jgi:hypothetical protein
MIGRKSREDALNTSKKLAETPIVRGDLICRELVSPPRELSEMTHHARGNRDVLQGELRMPQRALQEV